MARPRLHLPDVTLVGIDGLDLQRIAFAMGVSQRQVAFGAVKLFTHLPSRRADLVPIAPLTTVEAYSAFVMRELYRYIDTTHLLIVQWDGFVLNTAAWSDHFLRYDYIGAPWRQFPRQRVGNGGFSLRTRALMAAVAADPSISDCHPEDWRICRQHRRALCARGFRFAPVGLARRFSVEGTRWGGEFGFHKADISHWPIAAFADPRTDAQSLATFASFFPHAAPALSAWPVPPAEARLSSESDD